MNCARHTTRTASHGLEELRREVGIGVGGVAGQEADRSVRITLAQLDRAVRFAVRDTSPVAATEPRPLRVDAARNQERILAAAREAFAEQGLDVGVQEIARRAGVGKGTLFRHFASKDALIAAIFEDLALAIEASADRALEDADPWRGLATFLEEGGRMQAANMGYLDVMALQFGDTQLPANLCSRHARRGRAGARAGRGRGVGARGPDHARPARGAAHARGRRLLVARRRQPGALPRPAARRHAGRQRPAAPRVLSVSRAS